MKRVLAIALVVCAPWPVWAAEKRLKLHQRGSADRGKIAAPAPEFDTAAVNNAATMDAVGPAYSGNAAVRAQILLDRAHFSPGEIDGYYGDNLRVAIAGYQTFHNLPPSGVVDAATWNLLNTDKAPALVPYTITPDDVEGPFEAIPHDMMEQAKLDALGYSSPEEELGERFHLSPNLLKTLNPGKDLSKAGEQLMVPNVIRGNIEQAARVEVSKTDRTVSAFRQDGLLLARYPATMGSEHDPLPLGNWVVTVIQQNPVFNYDPDLFWNADPKDSKARIAPGPNNPVGVVWIGLSKEHYGIHGTPNPGTIGHTESHGCIRLTNWDAEELSKMIAKGTPVLLKE